MQKLTRIKLKLDNTCGFNFSFCQGSLFHGFLMETISSDYAEELHDSELHPYSQYIDKQDNDLYWVINCTNSKSAENIISKLLHKDYVSLKKLDTELKIIDKIYEEISYEDLIRSFYREDASRFITIRIKTPMSFKSNGEYCIFPDIRKIYKSLMNKYDASMKDSENNLFDIDTLEELSEKTKIIRYNLRSAKFPLEGITVPSFVGSITLKINAPQSLVNFANLLFKFGEFSGVGIKNSIGMGAISLETKETKEHKEN